jgi:homoserine kinase
MTLLARVRAPASTANVGPGFDCVAIALDLWNELEVREGAGGADGTHLGVRAFSLLQDVDGLRFTFVDRIPAECGLGSSASVIALGLVAATVVGGRAADAEELLAAGIELEGHGDNLGACLAGGVCLTHGARIRRVADDAPAVPIALVPDAVLPTSAARDALPTDVSHADAAYTAARAAILGAALATGAAELFAQALDDRLHEPYRARWAPLLEPVRRDLPEGALGATISGSGPTVIVWAHAAEADTCAAELTDRYPDVRVLRLAISHEGAHAL